MKIWKNEHGKVPIKSWCDDLEEGATTQLENLSALPFAFKHIAAMPDCHQGYGMCVGGVLATNNVVIPNAVGVDIGCGMCSIKTNLTEIDEYDLKKIMGKIRATVPVGMNHHKTKQDESLMPGDFWKSMDWTERETNFSLKGSGNGSICGQEYEKALYSLGSLGGGNHFCEVQRGRDGFIYIMIHSGSRNLGKKVGDYYNKIAKELNEKWFSGVPKEWDLAFLPMDTDVAQNYMIEMQYCVDFALANRKLMIERIKDAFIETVGEIEFSDFINIAHNYARLEHHYGTNVLVHRKGATSAKRGELGIIPGSQGTSSYIVKGKGNPESFESCSHGAGRKMGRKQAQKELDLTTEIKRLDDQGIIHGIRTVEDLDEASGAYKDILDVMIAQKDLVDIVVELKPLAVVKG